MDFTTTAFESVCRSIMTMRQNIAKPELSEKWDCVYLPRVLIPDADLRDTTH